MKRGNGPRRDTPKARAFAAQRSEIVADPDTTRAFRDRGRASSARSLERSATSNGRRPGAISPASAAQREAARLATVCDGCGRERSEMLTLDPAHLAARSQGGCDHELCTPFHLCRTFAGEGCHRLFDEGDREGNRLSLIEKVQAEPDRYREALQHALEHMTVVEIVQRLVGERIRWAGVKPLGTEPRTGGQGR